MHTPAHATHTVAHGCAHVSDAQTQTGARLEKHTKRETHKERETQGGRHREKDKERETGGFSAHMALTLLLLVTCVDAFSLNQADLQLQGKLVSVCMQQKRVCVCERSVCAHAEEGVWMQVCRMQVNSARRF